MVIMSKEEFALKEESGCFLMVSEVFLIPTNASETFHFQVGVLTVGKESVHD